MRPGAQAAFLATLRQMSDLGGQREVLVNEAQAILRAATVPVLLLHGRQDSVIACTQSANAQRFAPSTRLQLVDDCGHTPQLEQPAVFNAALQTLVSSACPHF